MKEETLHRLKDTGFPLHPASMEDAKDSIRKYQIFDYGLDSIGRSGNWLFPTLSELIEACGEPFRWLKHIPKGKDGEKYMAQGRPHWKDENGKGLREPRCYGHTPEEAVANLWLSLFSLPSREVDKL